MSWIFFVIICAAIGGFVFFLLRKKKQSVAAKHPLVYNVDIPMDQLLDAVFTPAGITVRSTVPVPAEALDAIDRGFAHTITNSRHYNPSWTEGADPAKAQVYLIPKMTTNVETDPGSPALLVRMLDSGRVIETIQAAGTNIGVPGSLLYGDDPRYPSIVVCEQSDTNWAHLAYLEESVRNEFEHNQEWLNDKTMFYSFAIAGDVHPHFPDWQ
jgi:hypothetical protein